MIQTAKETNAATRFQAAISEMQSIGAEAVIIDKPTMQRRDSLWYGGPVFEVAYDRYRFTLCACGEVRAALFNLSGALVDNVVDKNQAAVFASVMFPYIRTDAELSRACDEDGDSPYYLSVQNGNWWEVIITTRRGERTGDDWICDSSDYIEAVEELASALVEMTDWLNEAEN